MVPGLDQDKLQTVVDQIVHADEIKQLVVDWLADRSADEAEQVLNAHNIPCSKVMAAPDIARHPHYRAREMLIEWDDDIGGTIQGTGLVPKFSTTPSRVWRAAPTRGKDTEAVLDWLGYDESLIAELRKTGVVG